MAGIARQCHVFRPQLFKDSSTVLRKVCGSQTKQRFVLKARAFKFYLIDSPLQTGAGNDAFVRLRVNYAKNSTARIGAWPGRVVSD